MKTLAYIVLLFLSTGLNAQAEKELTVEVGWIGQRCVGDNGYCYVEPSADGNTTLRLNNSELTFIIYRDKLTVEEELKILGKKLSDESFDTYLLEEPFALSKDVTNQLSLAEGTQIPPGEYQAKITKETVEITFRL
ncbi:MAG TPA: hypothetical protein VKZ97_10405 [Flavobacteriaceae bacterium]|nr:hypothetical protein [Flavobacteriaceae bacterium]